LVKVPAGTEYFFDKHGALTFDCKLPCLVSATFSDGIPGSHEMFLDRIHILKQGLP